MTENDDGVRTSFLRKVRWRLRDKGWLVSVPFAAGGFLVALLVAPVSSKGTSPDKMTAAFTALLAVGAALLIAALTFKRTRLRIRPLVVFAYGSLAVVPGVVGVLPGLPDSFYRHRFGAPVLLGLVVAGTLGIFITILVIWNQDPA